MVSFEWTTVITVCFWTVGGKVASAENLGKTSIFVENQCQFPFGELKPALSHLCLICFYFNYLINEKTFSLWLLLCEALSNCTHNKLRVSGTVIAIIIIIPTLLLTSACGSKNESATVSRFQMDAAQFVFNLCHGSAQNLQLPTHQASM